MNKPLGSILKKLASVGFMFAETTPIAILGTSDRNSGAQKIRQKALNKLSENGYCENLFSK
jgi:hypothetical protein